MKKYVSKMIWLLSLHILAVSHFVTNSQYDYWATSILVQSPFENNMYFMKLCNYTGSVNFF